ncbi:MAG: nucleoside hydrolase [Chloroflexota bacterium]|nr:nucleoside hydrolase [Chloroflexota bacterium]
MISLILDTDIGDDVDDAFALAFAARHPRIRLCAVTTVLGDTRWRAALTLRLLDEMGVDDVPVAAGEQSDGVPGITLSGDVVLPPRSDDPRRDPRSAVDLMADVIAAAPQPVWLATVGPATNAARLLAERPGALNRLTGVVMMGGRHDPTNPREHNFGTDPAAAAAVCNSGRRVRVGDYRVTSQARLRRDDLPRLRRAPGIGPSLGLMLETYLDRRGRDWTSMYDPAVLTLALGEDFLRLGLTPRRAEVAAGQIRFRVAGEATQLRIAAAIDAAAFRGELLDVIGVHE